jgi:hypothetical protein
MQEFNKAYGMQFLSSAVAAQAAAENPDTLQRLQLCNVEHYLSQIALLTPGHSKEYIAGYATSCTTFRCVLMQAVVLLKQRDTLSGVRYHRLTDKTRYLNSKRLYQKILCLGVMMKPQYRMSVDTDECKEY